MDVETCVACPEVVGREGRDRATYRDVISPLPFIHYMEFQLAQRPVHLNMQMLRDPYNLWSLLMDLIKEVAWIEEIRDFEDTVALRISTKSVPAALRQPSH